MYGFQLGGGPLLVGGSALALVLFVAFLVSLEPIVVSLLGGPRGQWGPAVAFAWDVITGAVVGFPVFWLLDLPVGPAVGAAASVGAFYGWTMGYLVCGEASASVVNLVLQGGGRLRTSEHSYAQSLEVRGEFDAAARLYRQAIADTPRDLAPYLSLARLQDGPLRQPSDALATLRAALRDARLDERGEMMLLRRIIDVSQGMGRPFGGAPDLARYVDAHAEGPAAEWAATTLARMKQEMDEEREGPMGVDTDSPDTQSEELDF
jgi:tetratricopeptide (TPR) repeat protein